MSNLFVSIHGSDPGQQADDGVEDALPQYKFFDKKMRFDAEKVRSSFTAVVPANTIVVLFSIPNCLVGSDSADEIALMKVLSQPTILPKTGWVTAQAQSMRNAKEFKTTEAPFVNSALAAASIYFPGDEIYNNLMSFDEKRSYYDIFILDKSDGGFGVYDHTGIGFAHGISHGQGGIAGPKAAYFTNYRTGT